MVEPGPDICAKIRCRSQTRDTDFCVHIFSSKQIDLYEETFRGLVESVLDGFNGTVFAYGQTGTGKTFTMQGKTNTCV